jgi:hypothetical protein
MNKKVFLVIVAAAVILIGWFVMGKKTPQSNSNTNTSQNSSNSNSSNNAQAAEESGNLLNGRLLLSNNKSRGNLMLETRANSVFYISTSRDFSTLVGKWVKVTFEGDINQFKLVNIELSEGD